MLGSDGELDLDLEFESNQYDDSDNDDNDGIGFDMKHPVIGIDSDCSDPSINSPINKKKKNNKNKFDFLNLDERIVLVIAAVMMLVALCIVVLYFSL